MSAKPTQPGTCVGSFLYFDDTNMGRIARDELRPVPWANQARRVLQLENSGWFRYPDAKEPRWSIRPPVDRNVSCFVAGIVKGLVECDDPTEHFGSLLAFHTHARQAAAAGLVIGDHIGMALTEFGRKAYTLWDLASVRGRASSWGRAVYELPPRDT